MANSEYPAPEVVKKKMGLTGNLLMHYYWTRTTGGRFWGKEYAAPNISITGYEPGKDYVLISAYFDKASSTQLKGSYDINLRYYLVLDSIPVPNWQTMRYSISHTTGVSPVLTATKL